LIVFIQNLKNNHTKGKGLKCYICLNNSNNTINEVSLKELANTHNFKTGKWMITVSWSEADEVWKKLVNALLEGRFADHLGVRYIKVFGRSKKFNPHGPNARILVGTQDWTSEAKTMEVAKLIRSLGISHQMKYKPDLYSTLEDFQFEHYNIKHSVYHYY
jgi:hypothetical protein